MAEKLIKATCSHNFLDVIIYRNIMCFHFIDCNVDVLNCLRVVLLVTWVVILKDSCGVQ